MLLSESSIDLIPPVSAIVKIRPQAGRLITRVWNALAKQIAITTDT